MPGEKDGQLIVGTKNAAFMGHKGIQQNPQDKEETDEANSSDWVKGNSRQGQIVTRFTAADPRKPPTRKKRKTEHVD